MSSVSLGFLPVKYVSHAATFPASISSSSGMSWVLSSPRTATAPKQALGSLSKNSFDTW